MTVSRGGLLSALILMKQQISCFLTLLCNFHFLQQVGNMFFKSSVVIWHIARKTVTPLLGLGRSAIQNYIGDGGRQLTECQLKCVCMEKLLVFLLFFSPPSAFSRYNTLIEPDAPA